MPFPRSPPGWHERRCWKLPPPVERSGNIASSFKGVEKAYAIQAGREVRVIIQPEKTSDEMAHMLAMDIVKRVENELSYPGQIKSDRNPGNQGH